MQVNFDNITVAYGHNLVLEDFSMTITSGDLFTVLGPSGCGKTTLLRAIAGFIVPRAGKVYFGRQDMTFVPPHKRNTGLVFQDYALFPHLNVFENIAYGLRARAASQSEVKKKVMWYLERVGLIDFSKRAPSELSGGQRQRVALARALVIEPDVLLMDEPLSALDASLRQELRLFLSEIQREVGVTTVFVTHDQDEALTMSDRIVLMRNGQIEQMSRPHDLYHRPRTVYAAAFVGGANLLRVDVKEVHGKTATCKFLDIELRVSANGCTRGDPVKLCAHHQEIAISDLAAEGVPGTIKSAVFLGGQTSYDIELPSGESLRVTQSTGFGTPRFERGTKVSVSFSEHCCLVKDV